jgi:hypothetical protein
MTPLATAKTQPHVPNWEQRIYLVFPSLQKPTTAASTTAPRFTPSAS